MTKYFFDEFAKNVVLIASSTFFIYGLMYLGIPILSKIYGPEEYGKYTTIFSFIMLSSIIASAKYEVAILLPSKDEDALIIMKLCMVISVLFSCIIVFLLNILNFYHFEFLTKFYYLFGFNTALLIGFYICLITANTILLNWISRNKNFKILSLSRFIRFGTALSVSISGGLLYKSYYMLLIGDIIGLIISSIVIYFWSSINNFSQYKFDFHVITSLAKRYREFPLFSLPSTFLNKMISQSPIFLLSYFFTPIHVGNYGMCERLLSAPASLISEAISNVFRGELSSSKNPLYKKNTFYKVLQRLVIIAFPIFTILFFFGSHILNYMFGNQWELAKVYSKLLVLPLFFQFIFTPLTFVLFYFEKQKLEFKIQIFAFLLLIVSITIFYTYFSTDIALISIIISNIIVRILLEFYFSYKVITNLVLKKISK